MKTIHPRRTFQDYLVKANAKLPASAWRALAAAEAIGSDDMSTAGAEIADGDSTVVVMTLVRFRSMTRYIRKLEERIAQLEQGDAA